MKIIDLFNRVSTGNIPPQVIYNGEKYTYDKAQEDYMLFKIDHYEGLLDNLLTFKMLNDEVEIIEDTSKEDKKIEKFYFSLYQYDKLGGTEIVGNLESKINEIIDYINRGVK